MHNSKFFYHLCLSVMQDSDSLYCQTIGQPSESHKETTQNWIRGRGLTTSVVSYLKRFAIFDQTEMSNFANFKMLCLYSKSFKKVNSECNENSKHRSNSVFQIVELYSFHHLLIQSLPDKLEKRYMRKCQCLSKHEFKIYLYQCHVVTSVDRSLTF